ncbi:MAG: hypothetical protein U9O64_09070 [Campylobacterota bacterium]|nr:hypothetical protein [Campylobacterota bacterium]
MLLGYGRVPKDENFIVGTESGLKNLITSCEIASGFLFVTMFFGTFVGSVINSVSTPLNL